MSPDPVPPDTNAAQPAAPARRRLALHWQIVIGLIIGAVAGLIANAACPRQADGTPHAGLDWFVVNIAGPIGQIFLNLIFMVVLPLVFSALVLGIAELGDVRRLGRIGAKTLAYTLILSTCSVAIGVGLARTVQPGAHLAQERRDELRQRYASEADAKIADARAAKNLRETLLELIPRNPLQEMVGAVDGSSPGGGMLAVMFFALLFGIAVTLTPERTRPLIGVLEGIFDVTMVVIGFAMRLAPLAVGALVFRLTAVLGMDILHTLVWYVLTVLSGLALHLLIVYSLAVGLLARMNPLRFFSRVTEAAVTAFATSSSNATLPTALRVADQRLGLRREIGTFVLTVGATANQNGTALYEGVTVLFLAQVFGVDLTLTQQITVAVLAILAGIGTAGVPGGSLPLVVVILQTVRIPAEGIAIIIGIDRLLDMCRTTLNVVGDLAIATCVDRSERHRAARHARQASST
ncbi:MAG: dicarboxylate/amino acid:cation symporter [Phycisphaerae bacterium]|nr:dicarboxylate/amino acid:cation symporter [Phycisphaerae bacterium]